MCCLEDFVDVGSGGLRNPGLMTFTNTDPVTLAYIGPTSSKSPATVARSAQPPSRRMFGEVPAASLRIDDWLDSRQKELDQILF